MLAAAPAPAPAAAAPAPAAVAPARATLECAPGPSGPWRRVSRFRALGQMAWQRVDLEGPATTRFCRVFIRREGHASFRHTLHGVLFHCADGQPEEEE